MTKKSRQFRIKKLKRRDNEMLIKYLVVEEKPIVAIPTESQLGPKLRSNLPNAPFCGAKFRIKNLERFIKVPNTGLFESCIPHQLFETLQGELF